MNKEQVYDERISPLMKKVLDICREHGIAMLATFDLPTEEKPGLNCSTMCPDEHNHNPAHHIRAYEALVRGCRGPKPHEQTGSGQEGN